MADNFDFTPGSGKTGAADDIGGVLHPRVKVGWGTDGTFNDADTASGKALPVQLRDASGNAVAPLTESDFDTKIGSLTETAPASDTASSGLNGRLQRIAQRLTSLIALIPAALTGSGNFKVSLQESNASQAVTEADGASVTLGAKADAKSTATDTTAISAMSVWKQISASVQAIATAIAGTLTVATHAVTQSGTWNVTNVSGTVSLPTGASTLAEQQSQTTHLATIAGDTTDIEAAVELIDDAIVADDAAFTPASTKVMMAGFEFDDSSPDSVNEGDAGAARMSANRNVYMTIRDAAGNERGVNVNSSNQMAIAGPVTNAGTFATQVDGAALTALQLIDDIVHADDAAFTPGTSKVAAAGFIADESSTDSVDEGDVGAARMTLDRKQHVVTDIESNSMRISGVACTPKFAAIAASSSGNNTIVSAVNPRKIRVLAVQIIANGAVNAKWQSGAGGTDLSGLAYLAANGGYVLPYNPVGWFETASNTLLNLNLSGAVAVGGSITYIEV